MALAPAAVMAGTLPVERPVLPVAGLRAAPAVDHPRQPALSPTAAYPRQPFLSEPAVDPDDAAIRLGLTPYHDISRRLNAVMATSDRVSTEVLATTDEGREVVMVTLTAPETEEEVQAQRAMREQIDGQPGRAADDARLAEGYKLPVLVSANIHGNEFEGTDAALRLVEEWADSDDPGVERTLETTRVHLILSVNPDGRVDNTRRNAADFDLNRDLITATQPEAVALRDAIVAAQPVMALDLHGYVNGTLVEPTTPPHGENYEFDLLVRHAYANALGIEEAIIALGYDESHGVRPPQLPLRDWDEGWDGWPPIFTPQYAGLHGAVAHTVELPLRVNNASYDLPAEELQRRAAINTDIAHTAITASLRYVVEHRAELLADQIEGFRRGVAGEPQREVTDGLGGVIGPEDIYTADYPRAYVIPSGSAQRSAPAAARLVDHLVANGVEVTRQSAATTIGGTSYPPGSYVVDLHQARRGVARAILGEGSDLSGRVDAMYDISGWSHGLLWGADVATVPAGQQLPPAGEPVTAAADSGSVADSSDGWLLRLDDPADLSALATLLEDGVPVEWLDDGAVLVPADAADAASAVAQSYGVTLAAAPEHSAGQVLAAPVIGVAATAEERWAFAEMGLTVQPVSTTMLNDGLDLSGLDALYVSAGLHWRDLDAAAREELTEFVDDGGGLVGRGPTGAALNDALGLLDVTAVEGRSDANGVVAVDNLGGPVTGGAPPHTFVYSPLWFADLGEGVVADQVFVEAPLVSGHWRSDGTGSGGPDDAEGEALIVRGEVAGTDSRAVLLGSEPLFRAHPKGQYSLVARALLWSTVTDDDATG